MRHYFPLVNSKNKGRLFEKLLGSVSLSLVQASESHSHFDKAFQFLRAIHFTPLAFAFLSDPFQQQSNL